MGITRRTLIAAATVAAATGAAAAPAAATPRRTRPVIFVHGSAGSAMQFRTQAKRLASNVDALNLALRGITNSDTRLK